MEAAKIAGELLEAKDVAKAWDAFLSRLKVNLDGYPDRVAEALEDGMTLAERIEVLRKEMNAVRQDVVAEAQRAAEVEEAS